MKDAVLVSFSVPTILFRSIRVWTGDPHLARGFSHTRSSVVSISLRVPLSLGVVHVRQVRSCRFLGGTLLLFSCLRLKARAARTREPSFFSASWNPARPALGCADACRLCIYALVAFCGRTCGSQRFSASLQFPSFFRRLVGHVVFFHPLAERTSKSVLLPI